MICRPMVSSDLESLASARPEFGSHQTSDRDPCAVHDLDVIACSSTALYEDKPRRHPTD
jgi:hypothetical protein